MDQSLFWALPISTLAVGGAAAFWAWRLKVRFDRDHPTLTRAALKAEDEREAAKAIKGNVVPLRPVQKVSGPEPASGTHK